MDVKTMKKWLRRFAAIDRDKNGFITVEDFAKFLHLPNDACLQAVFVAANVVKKNKHYHSYFPTVRYY